MQTCTEKPRIADVHQTNSNSKPEALKHQKENLTVTYVSWHKDRPIGYVALATGSLRKAEMPSEIGKRAECRVRSTVKYATDIDCIRRQI
jgi:hypothetical protein